MKTIRTTQFILILLSSICVLLYSKCTQQENQGKDPNIIRLKCSSLLEKSYRREMIVQFNECGMDKYRDSIPRILDELGKFITPKDTCDCDPTLILYEIKQGINPEEAVMTTNDKLQPRGLGSAFFNFNLKIFNDPLFSLEDSLIKHQLNNQVLVAVLDGGINLKLDPDLEDYLWENPEEEFPNATEAGVNFTDSKDEDGMVAHGTIVSKIITANLEPDRIKIMDLRVIDHNAEGVLFDALCAMQFAINHDADIMNMSWGFYNQRFDFNFRKYIHRAKNEGIIIVASAGNDSINTDYCHHFPSGFDDYHFQLFADNVISVAYLDDQNDKLAPKSNFGYHSVSLAAPGTFGSIEGSSYSAPQITRIASILISNHPGYNYRNVIRCIKNQVNTAPRLPLNTEGKITFQFDFSCPRYSNSTTDEELFANSTDISPQ